MVLTAATVQQKEARAMIVSAHELAQGGLLWLSQNSYPGRGLVVGLSDDGDYIIQVCWIMGRSENSRNRIYMSDVDGRLYTTAAEPKKVKDASLIMYNAMLEVGRHYIVSNGDQTDTVARTSGPTYLPQIMENWTYEPDAPHHTQRITAVSSLGKGRITRIQMSIVRKSMFSDGCDRLAYNLTPHAGYGYCITTYAGDGNPLPPFREDPLLLPLAGKIEDILGTYWRVLDPDNRVSLAVKVIEIGNGRSEIAIINKYAGA